MKNNSRSNRLRSLQLIRGIIVFLIILPLLGYFGYSQEDSIEDIEDTENTEGLGGFRWDYQERETTWAEWVDLFMSFEETEEDLEEITPFLIRLERWYYLPRDLNTLAAEDLDIFFWLSLGEKKNFLDYRRKHLFTQVEELSQEDIISPENYSFMLPFVTVKKSSKNLPLTPSDTEISYGIALRAKELMSVDDFSEILKNYQLKLFGEIRQPGLFDVHYLIEQDPNETRVFDLNKWSLAVNLFADGAVDPLSAESHFTVMGGALKVNIHQSLLMATGYPLRKNERAPYTVKRNGSRIQGDKSSQEIFLQGFALDMVYKDWRLGTWAGQYRYDNELVTNTSNPTQVYATDYSFYSSQHRPFPEFTLTENLFGFLIEKRLDYHVLSMAFLYSEFSHPLLTTESDEFFGQSHWGLSWGWDLDFNRYRWYGEGVLLFNEKRGDPWGSRSYRASGGGITGTRIFFPQSDFFLSLRFIPRSYQAVHNFAYTRYSGNDEVGLLGGYRLHPLPQLKLVTSFDFFKQIEEDPLKFGIDLSELISYRHRSGYYNESQIRLRERGEWEDNANHFWEIRHRSGWKSPYWNIYGEAKMNGSLIEEFTEKSPHRLGTLLTAHGEYRYKKISTTVMEIMWTQEGPFPLYDLLYHNRFFNDLLYLNKDTFIIFFRQKLRLHSLLDTGFSLGFYWEDDSEGLFKPSSPDHVMFSFYISGEVGGR